MHVTIDNRGRWVQIKSSLLQKKVVIAFKYDDYIMNSNENLYYATFKAAWRCFLNQKHLLHNAAIC